MEFIGNFFVVASQVVTLFLLMGVGFVLAQLGKLHTDGVSQMSTLVLYVVTPCLMISAFEVDRAPDMVETLGVFFVVYAVSTLLGLAVAQLCFRNEEPDRKAPLRFGMTYGNNGFMGLPLVHAILGQDAVLFGVVSAVAFNFLLWTQGAKTMGGKVGPRAILVNPATIGAVIGGFLFFSGLRLPSMVNNAVSFMADLNTPLAMVVIGAQMASSDLGAVFRQKRLYAVSACKLLLIPTLTALLLLPLGLPPLIYCTMVLLAATPVAGVTSMFAQQFHRDQVSAAQAVTLSTLLSLFTLPCFGVLAQRLAGLI